MIYQKKELQVIRCEVKEKNHKLLSLQDDKGFYFGELMLNCKNTYDVGDKLIIEVHRR